MTMSPFRLTSRDSPSIRPVKEARHKHGPSGVFLVINSSGELGKPDFTHRRDLDDFVVCFDAFSTTALRDSIRTIINGALAAVSVSLENRYTRDVTFLGEVTYAVDPASHKPIYSFHPEGSFTATLSGTLDHQTLESIRKYARLLVEDEALEQVVRLLAHSHETKDRMLQSFIEAWAALEMFIERSFKRCYEREWRAAQPRGGVALFGSGSPGLGTNLLAPRANMRCVTESSEACAIMWLWSWSMVKMMRQQIARKIATIASVTWLSVHG